MLTEDQAIRNYDREGDRLRKTPEGTHGQSRRGRRKTDSCIVGEGETFITVDGLD